MGERAKEAANVRASVSAHYYNYFNSQFSSLHVQARGANVRHQIHNQTAVTVSHIQIH